MIGYQQPGPLDTARLAPGISESKEMPRYGCCLAMLGTVLPDWLRLIQINTDRRDGLWTRHQN